MCLWALNRTLTFHNASSVLSVDKNIRLWNTFYCYRTKNHCSSLPYCILSLHKEVFMCRTVYFITWASMCVPNNWHTATALDSLSLLYYYSKLSVFVTKYMHCYRIRKSVCQTCRKTDNFKTVSKQFHS